MLYPSLLQVLSLLTLSQAVYVSNLDVACLKCICAASTSCDKNYGCKGGYCGPFFINKAYWETADKIGLSLNDQNYESCVQNYNCAAKVVSNFMAKTGWDCNGDGVVDCDDYARIHFFGQARCSHPMENTSYNDRYIACMPPKPTDDRLPSK